MPAPGASLRRTVAGSGKADPVAALAASLSLDPSAFSLAPSAATETSARVRGPQYWDVRAGVRPREALDLSAHLVEAPRGGARADAGAQSDAFRPRARSPTFAERRTKTGVDAASQVPHGSRARGGGGGHGGALFNFDEAVAPRVELLARDVLAQALLELSHEGDLRALADARAVATAALGADAAAARAAAAAAVAAGRGRAAALDAARASYARQVSALERVSALAMAGGAVRGAVGAAFARATADGHFVLPARAALVNEVLPRIYADVAARTAATAPGGAVAELLDGALVDALSGRAGRAGGAARPSSAGAAAAARRYAIRVYVRLPRSAAAVAAEAAAGGRAAVDAADADAVEVIDEDAAAGGAFRTVVVGPLRVTARDAVADVEARIAEWLRGTRSRHTRRVLALADGRALGLFMRGARLPRADALLGFPLEELASLELRPMASDDGGDAAWRTDVEEEGVAARAGEGGSEGGEGAGAGADARAGADALGDGAAGAAAGDGAAAAADAAEGAAAPAGAAEAAAAPDAAADAAPAPEADAAPPTSEAATA